MPQKKKWTVLVWIAGDNNLEDFGASDIQEMKQVGSNNALNIVVQYDRMSDHHTRRYFLQKGTPLANDEVAELGETNTGDPQVAIDFFTWGLTTYPAERCLAVIWNHGSGIDESDIYRRITAAGRTVDRKKRGGAKSVPQSRVRAIATRRFRRSLFHTTIDSALRARAIALDDTSKDFLDNVELKRVLTKVKQATKRKIDVLGCDACLMNMVEIAHQLRGSANVLVGSEETEPGNGWPYDTVLKSLAANPGMTANQLGSTIVTCYLKSYQGSGEAVTQSALDLRQADAVAAAIDKLAKALIAVIKTPAEFAAVTKSVMATQSYELKDFLDLFDLCENLKKRTSQAKVKSAAQAVQAALTTGTNPLILAEGHKGTSVSRSRGVSIYFPRIGDVTVSYDKLDFAKSTSWDEFLDAYRRG